jgi:hypothetical protein
MNSPRSGDGDVPQVPAGYVPPRLAQKVDRLQQKVVSRPESRFGAYAEMAITQARRNESASRDVAEMDIAHLPAIVDVENRRNPGLNLTYQPSPDAFTAKLAALAPNTSQRALVRLPNANGIPSKHHVAIDVRRHENGQLSAVVIEPFRLTTPREVGKHALLLDKLAASGVDPAHVGVIEANQQLSSWDCAMFSLNTTIKCHKNKEHFDGLHGHLLHSGSLAPDQSREELIDSLERQQSPAQGSPAHALIQRPVSFAPGFKVLPADFFKHTNSSTIAELVHLTDVEVHGRSAGVQLPAGRRVNSLNHAAAETLPERAEQYRVTRQVAPGTDRTFSASVDGFRLQEIRRAMEAEQGQPVAVSKNSTAAKPTGDAAADEP